MNQAADPLSHHPKTENENFSDCESDRYKSIPYTVVCDNLCEVIKEEKISLEIKRAVQAEIIKQAPGSEKIVKVQRWFVGICSPMLIPRQLRFSLYSGAVITEDLM